MELYISLAAMLISLVSVIVSVAIYMLGISREKKQATLDAFNTLQEQVFDKLNQYTYAQIKDICNTWKQIENKKAFAEEEKVHMEYCISEYRLLSGYLARIEHFALGVNTGIYDAKIAERAGTTYLRVLYRSKLKPLIDIKNNDGEDGVEYYAEFRHLVESIEKYETP